MLLYLQAAGCHLTLRHQIGGSSCCEHREQHSYTSFFSNYNTEAFHPSIHPSSYNSYLCLDHSDNSTTSITSTVSSTQQHNCSSPLRHPQVALVGSQYILKLYHITASSIGMKLFPSVLVSQPTIKFSDTCQIYFESTLGFSVICNSLSSSCNMVILEFGCCVQNSTNNRK